MHLHANSHAPMEALRIPVLDPYRVVGTCSLLLSLGRWLEQVLDSGLLAFCSLILATAWRDNNVKLKAQQN